MAQAQQQQRPVPVPQTPELQSMPIRAYLDQTVVPILLDGTCYLFGVRLVSFCFVFILFLVWSLVCFGDVDVYMQLETATGKLTERILGS